MASCRVAKTYLYSNGSAEGAWYLRQDRYNKGYQSAPACEARMPRNNPYPVEDNAQRAARRARAQIRHYIYAMGATHLLTLTFRINLTDYNSSLAALQRFTRKVKAHISGWDYVAVPERQSRGAWHFHVAVRGYQNVDLLRKLWRECTPDGEGNIHVRAPGGRKNGTWARTSLIAYLSKYISKTLGDREAELRGRHRYTTSEGIEWEETEKEYFQQAGVQVIVDDFIRLAGTEKIRVYTISEKGVGWLSTV